MVTVLVTGMSATGKSSVLGELGERGYRVVDTDAEEWCEWVDDVDGSPDWVWREDRISRLLDDHTDGVLFIAGCRTNQGRFYDRCDAVVLLSAPAEVILERIESRDTNAYGKDPKERALIMKHLQTIEPLLRATATHELDATQPLTEVANALVAIATKSS